MPDPSPHQPHDKLFRHSLSLPKVARQFLEAWLPNEFLALVDWKTLTIQKVPTTDETLSERREDVTYRVQAAGRAVCFYILIEHQSRTVPDMALRCLEYTLPLWRKERASSKLSKKLPLVIPLVVHPGPGRWRSVRRLLDLMDIPEEITSWARTFAPDCGYLLAELAGHPMEKLASGSTGQAVMAALQADRQGKLGYENVRRIVATLHLDPDAPEVQAIARQLWTYLLHHSELKSEEIVRSTVPETTQPDFMSTAELLKQEGRQEGRQEGQREGRQEGQREAIKKLLKLRHQRVPAGLIEAIEAVRSAKDMDRLLIAAATSKTIEDFASQI